MCRAPPYGVVVAAAHPGSSRSIERHTAWDDSSARTACAASPTRDLTAELALGLSVAAAHVLGRGGRLRRAPPGRRGRPRPARVGGVPGGRRRRRPRQRRRRRPATSACCPPPPSPTSPAPRRRPRRRCSPRRHNADARQRHQVLRPRRPQARRRARGPHRGSSEHRTGEPWDRPTGAGVGRVRPLRRGLRPLRRPPHRGAAEPARRAEVVLDEAHGAAARVSPEAFARAGAEVVTIGAEPDGLNINDGYGSTHLENLLKARRRRARRRPRHRPRRRRRPLPGRGRAPATEVDGDQIMAVLALAMRERGALREDTVVAHRDVQPRASSWPWSARASRVVQTAVGDRYVLEEMKARRLRPRRRAVRPRHHPRPRAPPATAR